MDGTILEKKLKIEEKLAQLNEIAQKVDDLPTFTSNDRAFLEDLPGFPSEDGTKVLTATTSSGETSLSYEEIESGENQVYSTTPVKIGKWLNQDLYRVVVDTGALTNNADKAIPSGLTNENVVRMFGFAKDENGVTLSIPYGDGVAVLTPYYDPATHTINYVIKSNLSHYTNSYCVLEYTVTAESRSRKKS